MGSGSERLTAPSRSGTFPEIGASAVKPTPRSDRWGARLHVSRNGFARHLVWTVDAYGEDVAGLLAALDLTNVVLVGHSMGASLSLRAAALSPGRVRGIVAVDSLHDAEFDFSGERIEEFLRAFEADFAGTCGRFVDAMFSEGEVDTIRERVKTVGCDPARSATGIALMRSFGAIDMDRWFSEAKVPIRAINAAQPNPTEIETNRKYADFDAVLMTGVGHYPHVTRPDAFNPLLLAAIAEVAGP
jgi:pimeloyl-ACP methyl ester carboxylesterase